MDASSFDFVAIEMARRADQPGEEIVRLIRCAREGDLASFDQLVLLHERRVLRTALRLLGRPEDAQDAAQEVYLRLFRHLRRFDGRRDFATWLFFRQLPAGVAGGYRLLANLLALGQVAEVTR